MATLLQSLSGDCGYYDEYRFGSNDLEVLRTAVIAHYEEMLGKLPAEIMAGAKNKPITQYDKFQGNIDHSKYWTKLNRILPKKLYDPILRLPFFEWLKNEIGEFEISNEEGKEEKELYWRLVRPNAIGDVGPVHADAWFWELMPQHKVPSRKRLKVWVPLYVEDGFAAFRFLPGSHKKNYSYEKNEESGKPKPKIIEDVDRSLVPFNSINGQAIIFHDRLLHGGFVGGSSTRVSLEFTVLYD